MPRSTARRLLLRSPAKLVSILFLLLSLGHPGLALEVEATLGLDPERLAGGDAVGRVRLFAPDPLQFGSSTVHWDSIAFPFLLMQPSINPAVSVGQVDLTVPLLEDIGWTPGTATVDVRVLDPAGEGFNDPELGDARRAAVQFAADFWAGRLASSVPIQIDVRFDRLACTANGAVLAQAATQFTFRDFAAAPFADTWYHGALAEALAGEDLSAEDDTNPDAGELLVAFNERIDTGCLGPGTRFDYGFDDERPPATVSFVNVALHEIAHGLGFSNFADERTGELLMDTPDVYTRFTRDNTEGLLWSEMTDDQRVASALRTGEVVWAGPRVTEAAPDFLQEGPAIRLLSPPSLAGIYEAGPAAFGPPLTLEGVTGRLAAAVDGSEAPDQVCETVVNVDQVVGKVAVLDRGGCAFALKVKNAQDAGAVGVVLINDRPGAPPAMGGVDPSIVIASVSVTQELGAQIRAALAEVPPACQDDAAGLCLNNERFRVEVTWRDFAGNSGSGSVVPFGSDDSGLLWFFHPDNWELLVKVLDGCGINQRYWVFAAATTNVEYTLTVTDTATGEMKQYRNPLGVASPAITDTEAFAACP